MQYMPTLAFQLVCFMYSAGLGFSLGIVYDLIRIFFYLLTGSAKKLRGVRDIIYVFVCLAATFLFLLAVCDGQLFMYVFLAEGLGIYVYFYSLSSFVFYPAKTAINAVRRLFMKFKKKICILKTQNSVLAKKILNFLHKFTKKDLHIRHNIVYNFFVKLCSGSFILKNRGDEGGKGKETKT